MDRPLHPSLSPALTYQTDDSVYFFIGPLDSLSNFSAHTVSVWGKTFATVEHAFQWKKFEKSNPKHAQKIFKAGSPWMAKEIAMQKTNKRKDWRDVKAGFMKEIIIAKVTQHKDVKTVLVKTGKRRIIENAPDDYLWGCGKDGSGQNLMGNILMQVRDNL